MREPMTAFEEYALEACGSGKAFWLKTSERDRAQILTAYLADGYRTDCLTLLPLVCAVEADSPAQAVPHIGFLMKAINDIMYRMPDLLDEAHEDICNEEE